jgi:hypothetical protein
MPTKRPVRMIFLALITLFGESKQYRMGFKTPNAQL